MPSVKRRVPTEQVPKAWLEGVKGVDETPVIQITIDVPPLTTPRMSMISILDRIVPSTPKSSETTTETIRKMRDEREQELYERSL